MDIDPDSSFRFKYNVKIDKSLFFPLPLIIPLLIKLKSLFNSESYSPVKLVNVGKFVLTLISFLVISITPFISKSL